MQRSFVVLAAVLTTLLWAAPARATTITFQANLMGANEVPPNASPATGVGIFVFDDQNTASILDDTLSVNETLAGLIGGPAAAAHIHSPAGSGVNAPVVIPFTGFPNATSGSYSNLFAIGPLGATFEASLFAGTTYANIHDATFPGGEIRGQLIQVNAV